MKYSILALFLVGIIVGLPLEAASASVATAQELISAINDANANPGIDEIVLTADITLTAVENSLLGDNGLPIVSSEIIIDGNDFTISRDGESPAFRIFYINQTGNLTLEDISLSRGGAVDSTLLGAGVYNNRGVLTVTESTFSLHSTVLQGAAIYNNQGNVNLNSAIFFSNAAVLEGGSLYNNQGTISINKSDLYGSASSGGSLYMRGGTADIIETTLRGNTLAAGGGIYNDGATVNINRSILLLGFANSDGGGIYNDTGILNISNSTFSGNTALGSGGSLYNGTGSTVNITYSTFVGIATNANGTIFNEGTINITYSIVANGDDAGDCIGSGVYNTVNNLAVDACGSTPVTELNLLLMNNGGPTFTHALNQASNAINASAACDLVTMINGIDQRGAPRDVQCDIGAYEYAAEAPTPTPSSTQLIHMATLTQIVGTATLTAIFNATGTPAATSTAVEATATPTFSNLLLNGDFELISDDMPANWLAKNATADKTKCNKDTNDDGIIDKQVAYQGSCALQFKGSDEENSKFTQTLDITNLSNGDSLILAGVVNAKGNALNASAKVRVTYADETLENGKITFKLIAPTTDYTPFTGELSLLVVDEISSAKVVLQNKSTSGKVWFDAVSVQVSDFVPLLPLP